MPARQRFFRSPSPKLQQATIITSTHTRLSVQPTQPGPRSIPLEQRSQFEPAASWRLIGEVNDIAVIEMFRSYQHESRLENLNIIRDNNNKIYRRCLYTREHKLAVINFALNT
jgi:hypothetical protein